jgi:signal-transduction protein with cAMP-binding, CBS, and nucleotidyltransferase domain
MRVARKYVARISSVIDTAKVLTAQATTTQPSTRPSGNLGADVPFTKSEFNDQDWRPLNLPHDWAIEGPFDQAFYVAASSKWRTRCSDWIRDPILKQTYRARPLFDLRPIHGDESLWRSLQHAVNQTVDRDFLTVMANDCLASLPPLTFFQDAVVDESGERTEVFALQLRALGPIVEVGRVFGIANQRVLGSSTLERLELARSRMPAHENIFREAIDTLRVLLYLQARTGLRLVNNGAEILPSQLSRLDRQALKSGFRAIHNLLQFTFNRLAAEAPSAS